MNKKNIKIFSISFLLFFSMLFINIDGVKAIDFCSANDSYAKSVSCNYDNEELVTSHITATVYFGKTSSGKYCAEIKNVRRDDAIWNLKAENTSTGNGKVAFDLNDDTVKNAIESGSCPNLKFVHEYDMLNDDTKKFTVSDKKIVDIPVLGEIADAAGCWVTGGLGNSLGSECWLSGGSDWQEISEDEMKKAIDNSSQKRLEEGTNDKSHLVGHQSASNLAGGQVGQECTLVSNYLGDYIKAGVWILCIAGVIIVTVMTMINFIQAITGSDEDKLRGAIHNLWSRLIILIILLLLPMILGTIINMVNDQTGGGSSTGTIQIGPDGKPFCGTVESK